MAAAYEIPIELVIDDGNLTRLERRLEALRQRMDRNPQVNINTQTAQRAVDDLASTIQRISGARVNINLDQNNFRQQITEMERAIQQLRATAAAGLDSRQIFGVNGRAFSPRGIEFTTFQRRLSHALTEQRRMLANTMENLHIPDFGLPRNNNAEYVINAMRRISDYARAAGSELRTLGDGSLQLVQSLNGVTTSIVDFDRQGNESIRILDGFRESLNLAQRATDAFNQLSDANKNTIFDEIIRQYEKLGKTLSKDDLGKYITKFSSTIDEEGKVIKARVETMVDGVRTAFNFTGADDPNGARRLLFAGIDAVVTDNKQRCQELEGVLKRLSQAYSDLYIATQKGDTQTQSDALTRITNLENERQQIQQSLQGYEGLNRVIADYNQRMATLSAHFGDSAIKSNDMVAARRVTQEINTIKKAYQELNNLKIKGGSESQIKVLQTQIEQSCERIKQILGNTVIEYNKATDQLTVSSNINPQGIMQTAEQIDKVRMKFAELKQTIAKTDSKSKDYSEAQAIEKLNIQLDAAIKKYQEYVNTRKTGNDNLAAQYLSEAEALKKIALQTNDNIQKSTEYSKIMKDSANSMVVAFEDNSKLIQLAGLYDTIIQKVQEYQTALLQGNTNTANGIGKDITTFSTEVRKLEQELSKSKTVLKEFNDLKQRYQASMKTVAENYSVTKDLQKVDQVISKYEELFKLQERIGQLRFKMGSEGEITRLQGEIQRILGSLSEVTVTYDKATNTFSKPFTFQGFDDLKVKADEAKDAIKQAKDSINNIRTEGNAKQNNAQEIHNVQELMKTYDKMIAKRKEYLRAKNAGDTNTANDIKQQMTALQQYAKSLESALKGTKALADAQKYLKQAMAEITAKQADTQSNTTLKNYETQIKTLEQLQSKIEGLRLKNTKVESSSQISTYADQINQIIKKVTELGVTYDRINNKFTFSGLKKGTGSIGDLNVADIDRLNEALKRFQTTNEQMQSKRYDIFNQQAIDDAISKLQELNRKKLELERAQLKGDSLSTIQRLTQEVANLEKEYNKLLSKPLQGVLSGKTVGESTQAMRRITEETSKFNETLSRTRAASEGAGGGIRTLNGHIDNLLGKFVRMLASRFIFMQLNRAIYDVGRTVRELDTAMTNLQMITEKSDVQITNMMHNYANMAKELGVTIQTVAEGSAEWLRQGFSEEQTEQLLRASTMLSTVGNMEAAQSTEALTSIMNGFNLEASESMNVIDTLNQLDLKYATSAQELATAMQRVSSVAKTAGMDYKELASIITVVSSNTRLSAETIGNGIKSLLSRLQNIKVGKYLDDNNEALNDTEKVLNSLGISIRDSATEWRDVIPILDDVGSRWDKFTDVDRSAIATALGGTYQRNTLMSILDNWNEFEDAMDVAADSAGSTEQKYEAYMDSLEAKINQLKTAWSELLMSMNLSGVGSAVIGALTGIITFLDEVIVKTPLGTAVIVAFTLALTRLAMVKVGLLMTDIVKGLRNIAAGILLLKRAGGVFNVIKTGILGIGTASTGAAAGVKSLVAALKVIGPYAIIIAAVIAAVTAGLHLWKEWRLEKPERMRDGELEDYIDTAKGNVEEAQNALDQYNQKLDENKQKLDEINSLRGTSSWSNDLGQEAEALEHENAILERKIALEERNLELENRKLALGYNEQFKRDLGDMAVPETIHSSPLYDSFRDADTDEERSLVAYNETLRVHNQQVQDAIQAQNDYIAVSNNVNSTIEEREEAQEKMNDAIDAQAETEETLIDTYTKLHEHYDMLDQDNKALADSISQMIDNMYLFDESMAGNGLVTFGQHMDDVANAVENTISPVEELEGKLNTLSNIDITPVEDGFENIGEYLRSLDASTVEHLNFILDALGTNAEGFIAILSTMDSSLQIDWINSKFNEFKRILEDCTAEYSEFKKLAESNPSEEMQGIADMFQYLRDSEQYGIERYDMYNAALKGLGASTYEEAEQIIANVADLYDHATLTIKGTTTEINGSQEAISQFGKDILDLVRSSNGELGEFEETTRTLSGVTERELYDAYNKVRVAAGKGLINEELWSAQWADLDRYIIKNVESLDALQQQFKNLSDTASNSMKELDDSLEDMSIDIGDIGVSGSNVNLSQSEKQKIITNINKAIDNIQNNLGTSGIELDLPKLEANAPDIELKNKYEAVQNVSNQLQNLFKNNKFNIDPIKEIAENINSQAAGSITIDGNKIKFNTTEARNKFEDELQNTFKGINVGSILANAMNNGDESLTFEYNGQIDTSVFRTQLQTQLQTAISGMQLTADGIFLNTEGLQATITEVGTTAGETKETIQTSFDDAINYINGLNTNGITQQLNRPGTAAQQSASRVNSLITAVQTLDGSSATVTIKVKQEGEVPSSASSMVSKSQGSKGPGANGFVPGYAVGKRKSDGMTTPMRASSHINAMVGEEGAELKIDKDGKQEMVGMNGPELIHVKPGDTIVPHNVTDMITKGKINQHAGGLKSYGGTQLNDNKYHSKTQGSGGSSGGSGYSGRSSGSSGGYGGRSYGSSGGYSGGSSGGSGSSSSSSQQEKTDPAAEEELKQLEHNLKMERITQEEYVKEYTRIWKQYYKDKAQFRDEDWKMEEEIFEMQKEALEDQIELLDHELTMAEHHNASAEERIAILTKQQEILHRKAEESRARNGGQETEDSRDASEEWWDKEEEKIDIRREALEDENELLEHELTMAEYHNASAEEKIAILKEQQALQHKIAEEERARNNGQDTKESREASEQWWEYQEEIENIQHEVFDEQKDILDHQLNLLDNQKDKVDQIGVQLYNKYKDIYNNYKKLHDEATSLGVDLNKTIYGNVDLNHKSLIQWTDEYIAKYKEALKSLGVNIESLKGTTSQVLGRHGTYDNVEIAYSATIQTDQGTEVLSKSVIDKYINQLITNAGKGWTTEVLFALDKKGLEIDGKQICNILAAIGAEAEKTSRAMHLTGNMGEVAQSLNKLRDAASSANMSVTELMTRLDNGSLRKNNNATIAQQQIELLERRNGNLHLMAEAERKAKGVEDNELTRSYSDEWWENKNKILEIQEELYNSYIAGIEHENFLSAKHSNQELQQIANLEKMQKMAHERADALRKEGYAEDSEAIRNLQQQWWDFEEQITSLETSIHDNYMANKQDEIDALARQQGKEHEQLFKYGQMQYEIEHRIADLKKTDYAENIDLIRSLNDEYIEAEEAKDAIRESLYQNQLKRREHEITSLERSSKTEGKQILQLMDLQELAYAKADAFRARGYAETSDEMMELAEQIWDYADRIQALANEAFDDQIDNLNRCADVASDTFDQIELTQAKIGESLIDYESRIKDVHKEREKAEKELLTAYKQNYVNIMKEIDRLAEENADANAERIQQLEDQARDIAKTIRQEAEKMKQAALEEQEAIQTHQESIIAGLQSFAQDLIDELEKENDAIQEKIDLLEEEMDAEDKITKEKELQDALDKAALDLAKKQEALESAKKNRVKRVYYAERGWVWEQDTEAVDEANEALEDAKKAYEDAKKALEDFQKQQLIDAWRKEIEANNKKIQSYNDYIRKLGEVTKQYEDHINRMNAAVWLGVIDQKEAYDILNSNTTEAYNKLNTTVKNAYGKLNADTDIARQVQALIHKDMEDNLNLTIQNATGYLGKLRDSYVDTAASIKEIELTSIEAWEDALVKSLDNVEAQMNRAIKMVEEVQKKAEEAANKKYDYEQGYYDDEYEDFGDDYDDGYEDRYDHSKYEDDDDENDYSSGIKEVRQAVNGKAPKGSKVGDIITTHGGSFLITGGKEGNWQSKQLDWTPSYATPGSNTWDWYYNTHKIVQAINGKGPKGLKIGDIVTTHGGAFEVTEVISDGNYKSKQVLSTPCYATPGSDTSDWYYQNINKSNSLTSGLPHMLGMMTGSGGSNDYEDDYYDDYDRYDDYYDDYDDYDDSDRYDDYWDRHEAEMEEKGWDYAPPGSIHLSRYANGGIIDYTGEAEVHGSARHSEVVFNSEDAKKLWSMIHMYNPDYALANSTNAIYSQLNKIINGISNRVHDTGTTINISSVNLPSVQQPSDFVRKLKTVSLNRKG